MLRLLQAAVCGFVYVLPVVALFGCESLAEFRTREGEVFRGRVVGTGEQAAFIRSGFADATVLELTFDPMHAAPPDDDALRPAGALTTYTCAGRAAACDADDRRAGSFSEAALEPIPQLSHDALGVYDLPGNGRLRNYMFSVRFTSGTGFLAVPRTAMVFLSLLENGDVEVRVVAASVLGPTGVVLHEALFGVFTLQRGPVS